MTTTKAALTVMLMIGGATPALAQYGGGSSAPQPIQEPTPRREAAQQPAAQQPSGQPQRQYNLSRAERVALQPALAAATASDWATATTALAAAEPQVRGNDAKYLVGQIRLRIGIGTQNRAVQSQAVDELLASGAAQPSELRALYDDCVRRADAAIDQALARDGLDAPSAEPSSKDGPFSLRWILLHMIEEYARHNGHADLIRESIDGMTGE